LFHGDEPKQCQPFADQITKEKYFEAELCRLVEIKCQVGNTQKELEVFRLGQTDFICMTG